MAFSITELENYDESNGAGDVTSKTTGTLSTPANSLILVFAFASDNSQFWDINTLSVTDSVDGATGWTGLDSQVYTSTFREFGQPERHQQPAIHYRHCFGRL